MSSLYSMQLFIFFQLFDQLIYICRKPRHQNSLCHGSKYSHCDILCRITGTGCKNIDPAYMDPHTSEYQWNIFILHSLGFLQRNSHKILSICCDQQFRFNIIHKRFHKPSPPCSFVLFYELLRNLFHRFFKIASRLAHIFTIYYYL